jgi:hypothetical protein
MKSDFAAARVHLDRACHYLQGIDHTSQEVRSVLDELIETVAVAECGQWEQKATVLRFPARASQ